MSISKATQGAVYIATSKTAMSTEAMTETAGMIYQITNSAHRIIDPNSALSFSTGTIDKSWGDDGIDYFTGRVKMTASGLTVTATGYWCALGQLLYVYNAGFNMQSAAADITPIGVNWKQNMALLKSAQVTLQRYRYDGTLGDSVDDTDWFLLKLMIDDTYGYWFKGLLTSLAQNKAVGQVDTEPMTLEVSGPVATV